MTIFTELAELDAVEKGVRPTLLYTKAFEKKAGRCACRLYYKIYSANYLALYSFNIYPPRARVGVPLIEYPRYPPIRTSND